MSTSVQNKVLSGAFSIEQAAGYLGGISRQTVWRLTKDGKLPVVKLRGRTLISRAAYDALLVQSAYAQKERPGAWAGNRVRDW